MDPSRTSPSLEALLRHWRLRSLGNFLLLGGLGSLPVLLLVNRLLEPKAWVLAALAAALSILFASGLAWSRHWFSIQLSDVSDYLNRTYPQLESSVDLLLRDPEDLTAMGRRQRLRVAERLADLAPELPVPAGRLLLATFAASVALSMVVLFMPTRLNGPYAQPPGEKEASPPATRVSAGRPSAPKLESLHLHVTPPAYTRLASFDTDEWSVRVPEGSRVRWIAQMAGPVQEVDLRLADRTPRKLRQQADGRMATSLLVQQPAVFQLVWQGPDTTVYRSEYGVVEIRPDQPPSIEVENLPPYVEYPFVEGKTVAFTIRLSDDYGIGDARLIATLSSGSGESVQFREDTLRFRASFARHDRRYSLPYVLNLNQLGMGPGDELYLHIEARDNRTPEPQWSRTSKFILAFQDHEAESADLAGGLPINRLPEYFRSQRQIIIDTEALIERRGALTGEALLRESNQIAIDQKLLRLRYGQFLGEEFQTVIGAMPEEMAEQESETGADHDHEGHDHEGHDHSEETSAPSTVTSEDQEIAELEPYYHTHDMTAEATFFDAATQSKLRAALAQMWDAELHLRMGRPRQALPYEYRALQLIKEIQQASRIYVQRIGFEPPNIPVAEKRLTGELDEILDPQRQKEAGKEVAHPAILAALPDLEAIRRDDREPTPQEYERLQAAGEELARLALDQAGVSMDDLRLLRELMEGTRPSERPTAIRRLQALFFNLLPEIDRQPRQAGVSPSDLYELYLRKLQ